MEALKRVNIGCGQTPIVGWLNYDNSFSVRFAKCFLLIRLFKRLGLLEQGQKNFISFARNNNIVWANAAKHIPQPDNSVEVLYTSHMIEHLDREETKFFLQEALRVLAPNGIIRIAVPDLHKLVNKYIAEGDADLFIERSLLTRQKPKTLLDRLKSFIVGDRHHLWMYDGPSMARLLSEMGFKEARILEAGLTTISDPGELNLYERSDESVYVEACKA